MITHYYKKVIVLALLLLAALGIVWLYNADFGRGQTEYGVTFSQKYATSLELDWRETFLNLLDDLKIRKFRLIVYWDLIEKKSGDYDFTDIKWQLDEVQKRGGEVILTIGNRGPRWPECHWPTWIFDSNDSQRESQILSLLKETVGSLADYGAIKAWQVENEPFLRVFGECPKLDKDFYKKEVSLVRSLDQRPIVVTESGELSTWLNGGLIGDQVGSSLYRITWSRWFGYFYYPLPPAYYYLKSRLVKLLTPVKDLFISEMQMEPWVSRQILLTPI